jgi:hypothetical protein
MIFDKTKKIYFCYVIKNMEFTVFVKEDACGEIPYKN